ncbi:acyltransferase [Desulfovibrio fairfieldensis]|uniref:Hexapeptide transferase n=1 Tax=Desulfovibrio fairfieldensis TaxID=44742 RepID=A0A0X8JM43_9BACT|nr:acyltransferase [Desulfovibrio fairfieldensis]AMD90928.1 hexapeptide transferase [Desulfovibrio fairfieldensis]GKG94207.1 hexapeptide transferase [Desulfovibrionaceae bacterium]GKI12757.1 hexapeptide transferase [Desulfovibrionaceae bacterium]
MNILRKALQRGLTPSNIISYVCLESMRLWGAFWGTVRLRCKAALLGVAVGPGTRAHGPVGLLRWPGGSIRIGARASLISSRRRATAASLYAPVRLRVFGPGAAIEIGEGAQLSGTSVTARSQRISIGRQVLLAPNCVIVDSDFHAPWPPEARATEPGLERDAPVSIGDYVWIGMNCLILKGVSIGEGAMIGAGSVVTRDVPPFCLAAGAPARVLRRLGPEDAMPGSEGRGA